MADFSIMGVSIEPNPVKTEEKYKIELDVTDKVYGILTKSGKLIMTKSGDAISRKGG